MIKEVPGAGAQAKLIGAVGGLKWVLAAGCLRFMDGGGFGTKPHLLVEMLLHVEAELHVFAIHCVSRVEGVSPKGIASDPLQGASNCRHEAQAIDMASW